MMLINLGVFMAGKGSVKLGFEKQIWDAACVLWGHIPAAEYRKVIIGLIFLRYISAAFEKRYNELLAEGDGFEMIKMLIQWKTFSMFLNLLDGQLLQLRSYS